MKEVSCRATAPLLQGLRAHGILPSELVRGTGLSEERLSCLSEWLSWKEFLALNGRVAELLGSEEKLVELGRSMIPLGWDWARKALSFVAEPLLIYQAIHRWVGPAQMPLVQSDLLELPDGKLELCLAAPYPHEYNRAFFLINQGVFEAAPTKFGLDFSAIELSVRREKASFLIQLPPSRSVFRRLKLAWNSLLAPEQIILELAHQQERARSGLKRQRELNRALVEQHRLALLGEVAAELAHELRNPLTSIQSAADLVVRVVQNENMDRETAVRVARNLLDCVQRMNQTISTTQRFARTEEQEPFVVIPVSDVIEDAVQLTRGIFDRKGIQLVFEPTNDQVLCRPMQLSQVLVNLFTNAVDAVSELPERWVRVSAQRESLGAGMLTLAVTDSGPGIPEELRTKIFDPFFTTKPPGKGTGLGLSISRRLLRDQGGELSLGRSESGEDAKYATFLVSLPRGR